MTTEIGFVIDDEKNPGVLLASDITLTHEGLEDVGDALVKTRTRSATEKILANEEGTMAMAMSGLLDESYSAFVEDLLGGKIDFRKALRKGGMDAFARLNMGRQNSRDWDHNRDSHLLVACYEKEGDNTGPSLYRFFPLGQIVPVPFFDAIGSGAKFARSYVDVMLHERGSKLDMGGAIGMVNGAIGYSARDLYTGGLDMVILERGGVVKAREIIDKHYARAEQNALKEIKKEATKLRDGSSD